MNSPASADRKNTTSLKDTSSISKNTSLSEFSDLLLLSINPIFDYDHDSVYLFEIRYLVTELGRFADHLRTWRP